jgi:hypothetical protein
MTGSFAVPPPPTPDDIPYSGVPSRTGSDPRGLPVTLGDHQSRATGRRNMSVTSRA